MGIIPSKMFFMFFQSSLLSVDNNWSVITRSLFSVFVGWLVGWSFVEVRQGQTQNYNANVQESEVGGFLQVQGQSSH